MRQARMIGYRVQKYAELKKVSTSELGKAIGCSEPRINSFLKGRSFVSFDQLSTLARTLGVEISSLLTGSEEDYNKSVVHCMNEFSNTDNREKILDIIDEYLDVIDSLSH